MIFDQYQRYKNAEQIINAIRKNGECFKILEVGSGEFNHLEKFLPDDNITYLDIVLPEEKKNHPSYRLGDASNLDFEDDAFDIIVALDVYEHVPRERRADFLSEIVRVSSRLFVIGAPFDTGEVKETERRVNRAYRAYSHRNHPWLIEHIENGLPVLEETIEYLKQSEYEITAYSHGNLNVWERLMNIHLFSGISQELVTFADQIFDYYNNCHFPVDYSETDYRQFIVGTKNKETYRVEKKEGSEELFEQLTLLEKQFWALCSEAGHTQQLEALYKESLKEKEKEIEKKAETIKEWNQKAAQLEEELEHYKTHYRAAMSQSEELKRQLQNVTQCYNEILDSECWKITKPLRFVLRWLKTVCCSNRVLYAGAKWLKTVLSKGFEVSDSERQKKAQERKRFRKNIKFSILVPLYNTPQKYLEEMIESVQSQTYAKWELCLADGSDEAHAYVEKVCSQYMQKDARIKYKKLSKNDGISENTNAAVKMATGQYIGLLDHDDLLHPSVLFEYMKVICKEDADLIYCDEDKFETSDGGYFKPAYKPDFSIDFLRSNNYLCHFMVFRKTLLKRTGLFRKQFDGAQDHDMVLRLVEVTDKIAHVPQILYHWRVSKESVAYHPDTKSYAAQAGIAAVNEHLERCGLKGSAESSAVHPNAYRIRYELTGNPLVSILIPNKDHVTDLSRCINSIISKSTYRNFEIIIIENNSVDRETFDYYKELESNPLIQVVVHESGGEFNYSAINNFGIRFAKGEHILLLNNDIEVITENWIEEMLMFSQRDDVGAVGAKLYYPNDTLQHAGVIVGLGGVADHSHKNFPREEAGYMMRCCIQHNLSAVTAACLMIKRSVFDEVGGLDEENFKVAFNDVDLCMKVREKGYLIVWTPYAEAYHYESISRGAEDTPEKQKRFQGEIAAFRKRWRKELAKGDPYYNPNLPLNRNDFFIP